MTAANYYHVKVGWILHGRPARGAESYVNVPRETMHVRTATVFHVEHPIFMSMLHRSIDPHEALRGRFSGPHDFTGTIPRPCSGIETSSLSWWRRSSVGCPSGSP